MKSILFGLVFLFSISANAQNLLFGFDAEIHQVRIERESRDLILGGHFLPMALHITTAYSFLKKILLEARIGRTFHSEFSGWEFGINGRYNFWNSLFITAGLLQHSNEGGMVQAISYISDEAGILMFQLGAGINISPVTSAEINYFIPTEIKKIGHGFNFGKFRLSNTFFTNMIRLNFRFAWEL